MLYFGLDGFFVSFVLDLSILDRLFFAAFTGLLGAAGFFAAFTRLFCAGFAAFFAGLLGAASFFAAFRFTFFIKLFRHRFFFRLLRRLLNRSLRRVFALAGTFGVVSVQIALAVFDDLYAHSGGSGCGSAQQGKQGKFFH